MIARLLDTGASLLVYFCAASLIAVLVIAAYVWNAWELDAAKLDRMLAVARGEISLDDTDTKSAAGEVPAEEVSYQQILEHRAAKVRDIELRELALQNALNELKFEQRQLADQQAHYRGLTEQFEAQLLAVREGAEATGREIVRATLQSLKAPQAKEQLSKMLASDEMDEVVILLAEMPASGRAKIIAEFKTPEDSEELAEVLRRIRLGAPQAPMAEQAMNQLNPGDRAEL